MDIEQIMKQNQNVLFLLREPFSSTFKPMVPMNYNYKMAKDNQIYHEDVFKTNDADLETNDDDDNMKISPFEEIVKLKMEYLLRKHGGFKILFFNFLQLMNYASHNR